MTGKIRLGIIGTNFITDRVLAGARLDQRLELTAVCSRAQETADRFAEKHGIPYRFVSLEKMLDSKLIDALYIATPNYVHAAQTIMALERGIHVLCEKPIASNTAELLAMIDAAWYHKVLLMEAMKPTLTPNFRIVRQRLGEIGRIRRYFSAYCQYSSRYDAYKSGVVMNAFKPELSNGAMMDIGIYTVYPMVVLFGKPDKIMVNGFKLETGVDAQGTVSFSYGDMTADVIYSKIVDSQLPTEIQGEEGTITLDRVNIIGKVSLQHRNGVLEDLTQPHCGEEYYYEIKEFFDLIEAGNLDSSINSHRNSLITMEIIDEVRKQIGVVYPADEKPKLKL